MVLTATETALKATEWEKVVEKRVLWMRPRPVTFAEFLDLFGEDDDVELIDGAVVKRMSAQLDHEKLFAWLMQVLGVYVEDRNLGLVVGSRVAVEINRYRGRLPDLLFVRRERLDIVKQKAIYGAPDLVIELVSPNDRPSDLIALQTDYRNLGVPEMWFIDQGLRHVRLLRRRGDDYDEEVLTDGVLRSDVVEGFALEVEWLFAETRPAVRATLERLLKQE
jgi:Uma2 family endonuclease